jgi:ribosomal protein S18 acetylase RimI-like enzyme
MSFAILPPEETHRADWERLYRGYADHYRTAMDAAALATVWGWLHDPGEPLQGRLTATTKGEIIGLMHFRAMPSPLRGARIGFLDDLYVDPAHRGNGAVDAMLAALREEARRQGWPFVRWITREDNYRARGVYDRHATRTDWLTYQLDT